MKKNISWVLILLSLILALNACQFNLENTGDNTETDDTGTETVTDAPVTPTTVDGIWYSAANQTVLEISDDLTKATYYQLKVGYYQYESAISGACIYEDYILTLNAEDGITLSWIFDTSTGTLSASNGSDRSAYTKREDLPTEAVVYLFPDFAALNCENLITLGSLTGLTFSNEVYALAAIDIFNEFYSSSANEPAKITDRVAQAGDYVNIDYTGYLDGVAFQGGAATDQDIAIVESSGYIPGFAEGIIGHAVGTTFDVPVTFPEDYGSTEMAGKSVIFTMTLNAIYDLTIPDSDIATLTENEYTTYQALLDDYSKEYITDALWNTVMDSITYTEVPEVAYLYFLEYYRDMYHYYAFYYGMDYEAFLSMYRLSDALLLEQSQSTALQFMTVYAISAKNNVHYTQEEYNSKLEEYIQDYMTSTNSSREEAEAYVLENETNYLSADLLFTTVMNWLFEQNTK